MSHEHDFQEWYSSLCHEHVIAQQSKRFLFPVHPDSRNLRLSNSCIDEDEEDNASSISSPSSLNFSPAIHIQNDDVEKERIAITKSISLEDYQDFTSRASGSISEPTVLNLLLPEETEMSNLSLRNLQTPTGIPPHYALESPNLYFPNPNTRKYE
jgi:hypothetical protein